MKCLLVILTFLIVNSNVEAKYTQKCEARYEIEGGWSKKYTVEVTFISGYELNQATSSYKYATYSIYAVIFWSQGQASVIKISTFLICGTEVDKNCITSTYRDLKGEDQDGDEWKICVSDYCY